MLDEAAGYAARRLAAAAADAGAGRKQLLACAASAAAAPAPTPGLRPGPRRRDAVRAKWLHHRLKVIHRALKKAKQFEVRKISRRMAQAKDGSAKGK